MYALIWWRHLAGMKMIGIEPASIECGQNEVPFSIFTANWDSSLLPTYFRHRHLIAFI